MKQTRSQGAAQHEDPHVDFGTTGLAQLARPSTQCETIQAGVKYRQMHDTHPIDVWTRTAQLTDRQIDAAWMLTKAFRLGFPPRAVTPAYGASRGGDSSPESAVMMTQARRNYDCWVGSVPPDCRHVIARMVRGEYPGVSCGLQLVRRGLDAVADALRLPHETMINDRRWVRWVK